MSSYEMAWLVFAVAATGMLITLWFLLAMVFKEEKRRLIWSLCFLVTVFPWYSYEGMDVMAPAIIVIMFDIMQTGLLASDKAIMLVGASLAIVILLMFQTIFKRSRSSSAK